MVGVSAIIGAGPLLAAIALIGPDEPTVVRVAAVVGGMLASAGAGLIAILFGWPILLLGVLAAGIFVALGVAALL